MSPRILLPSPLDSAAFTRADALARGLGKKRVDGPDLLRPFHGVRHPAAIALTFEARCRALALRVPATAFFNSTSAARIMGLPLPLSLLEDSRVHVAVVAPARAPSGRGVIGHQVAPMGGDARTWHGLRVSSPERVWCELGTVLDVSDLVAVGDYLIHWRRPFCTTDDLADAMLRYPGRRGRRTLTAAHRLLNERSESPQESRLRVLLLAAGVEGLAANLVITVRGRNYRADLALPRWKVAIEYQSDYHRETAQWRRDMSKREEIATVGWRTMEVNADDLHPGGGLADRVRAVIADRPDFA